MNALPRLDWWESEDLGMESRHMGPGATHSGRATSSKVSWTLMCLVSILAFLSGAVAIAVLTTA